MIEFAKRQDAWFPYADSLRAAPQRLFVLPYAGGGAAQFLPLRRAAPDSLDVQPIQLPGRESRMFEAPIGDLAEMIECLRERVVPYLDRPYAFLGYSMGARLALGLAHALVAGGHPGPGQLIVAAHAAPVLPSRVPEVESLDSEAFWKLIASYEGTPKDALEHDELKKLVEPTLRADFRVARQAVPRPQPRLNLPILAIAGQRDPYAGPGDMRPWQDETTGSFQLETIDGGHFFLRTHLDCVASHIFNILRPVSPQKVEAAHIGHG